MNVIHAKIALPVRKPMNGLCPLNWSLVNQSRVLRYVKEQKLRCRICDSQFTTDLLQVINKRQQQFDTQCGRNKSKL